MALDIVRTNGFETSKMNLVPSRRRVVPDSHVLAARVEEWLAGQGDGFVSMTSVSNTTLPTSSNEVTHQSSSEARASREYLAASEERTTSSTGNNPSLFAKLPGELRNRIYRTYFEDFREDKEQVLEIKQTAPDFFNLLHTDHMIRSEASSIFYEEHLCVDTFLALTDELEGAMEARIKSICELVAIYDIHLRVSVTGQEMITMNEKMVREMPFSWNDHTRCDFVNKLSHFIATETKESFACSIGLQIPQEEIMSTSNHMVYVGRKVYASPSYRIERVDPEAISYQLRRLQQQTDAHEDQQVQQQQQQDLQQFHAGHMAHFQHFYTQLRLRQVQQMGPQPAPQKPLMLPNKRANAVPYWRQTKLERQQRQRPETHNRAEFLRVEGPLAELDWQMF
jgi:hypothetical protein